MRFLFLLAPLILLLLHTPVISQIAGETKMHIIESETLGEARALFVATPANYKSSEETYPVLYVLDGEYAFSYAKGAADFLSNAFGYLPNLIVVGIANTDRSRDMHVSFAPDGEYIDFVKFLDSEVLPFINKNYRSNGFDLLYGWSSSAGICSYFLATNPQRFDGYIETGTGIGPKTAAFMAANMPGQNYTNTYLYAATEGEGPRVAALEKYEALIRELQPEGLRWQFAIEKNASHVGVMAQGLYDGLQFIFKEFYIPDAIAVKGADENIAYYKGINKHYGFTVKMPLGAINESAGKLFQAGLPAETIKLLTYGIQLYPSSSELLGSLGEVYQYLDQKEMAIQYYKLAREKSGNNTVNQLKYKILLMQMESK